MVIGPDIEGFGGYLKLELEGTEIRIANLQ